MTCYSMNFPTYGINISFMYTSLRTKIKQSTYKHNLSIYVIMTKHVNGPGRRLRTPKTKTQKQKIKHWYAPFHVIYTSVGVVHVVNMPITYIFLHMFWARHCWYYFVVLFWYIRIFVVYHSRKQSKKKKKRKTNRKTSNEKKTKNNNNNTAKIETDVKA